MKLAIEPDCCLMPEPAPRVEATIYKGMRDTMIKAHCASPDRPVCSGAITITAKHITFNCKICGDARKRLTEE